MPLFKATIEVLLHVNDEGEACDAIAEALRPLLLHFNDDADTAWVDWRYASGGYPEPHDGHRI